MMIILRDVKERQGNDWVATIGFFDGVHQGHRFLIDRMREVAERQALPTALFTFAHHPRVTLHHDYQPKLLNSFDERMERLASTGIDYCVLLDFTPEMAAITAHDFITRLLSAEWHVRTLFIGHDHRFGRDRVEGFPQYVAYGASCGMEVLQAPSYQVDGVTVSSSKIRALLAEGKVSEATKLLGVPYRLKGHVIEGHKVGRTLGFPTANIRVDEPFKVTPGRGVYAVWVHFGHQQYKGMLSISNRPTLGGGEEATEVHLLHFSGMIYQQEIEVAFIYFLRHNIKFESRAALIDQLKADREEVDRLL